MAIIGISGPPCSGKDTIAEYICKKYEYNHISSGDLLRNEAERMGVPKDRDTLRKISIALQNKQGFGWLIESVLNDNDNTNVLFTGLRSVASVEAIVGHNGKIIYVDSPLPDRYKRSILRGREDNASYGEFVVQDNIENSDLNNDRSLSAIKKMASFVINNSGTAEELFSNADRVMSEILNY